MKILIDTSAYVALKRGHNQVAEKIRNSKDIYFSVIVLGELLFGFRNGTYLEKNQKELNEFLSHSAVHLKKVTEVTADRFGRIAAYLRSKGTPIPTNDIWIAAQAMETGAELITSDKHFEKVAGLVYNLFA